MESLKWVVAGLGVAGAVLPIIGVWAIYRRAKADAAARRAAVAERGHDLPILGDMTLMLHASVDYDSRLRGARRDLTLVATGFVLTAVAAILGPFVP